jgi:drug/metabolite transporter (DMT)-like permease
MKTTGNTHYNSILSTSSILSGAIVWGLIWYPYRVLQAAGLPGPLATFITYSLAMVFGGFMLPQVLREVRSSGGWILLLLLSAGWTNVAYVLAMLHGEVMRVLLLFYLAPFWTILLSYVLLGERLNRYGYFIIALSLCGAYIMLWTPGFIPFPQNGPEWLGLTAGIGFASTNVLSRRASHLSIQVKSFSVWLGTALLAIPFVSWQPVTSIAALSWLILVLLGIVLCAVSFAVQYGVTHMPANRAILLFLFELVTAAIASFFLADETMGLREWAGAGLIVSASLLSGKLYTEAEKG